MNIVCDGKFAKEFISSICSGLPLPGQKQDFSISGFTGFELPDRSRLHLWPLTILKKYLKNKNSSVIL